MALRAGKNVFPPEHMGVKIQMIKIGTEASFRLLEQLLIVVELPDLIQSPNCSAQGNHSINLFVKLFETYCAVIYRSH